MEKLTFEQWKNSMSFLIDDEFDNQFLQSISPLVDYINANCGLFIDREQLATFITVENDFPAVLKLKALISLLGLSEERLKRVMSLVRYKFYNVIGVFI